MPLYTFCLRSNAAIEKEFYFPMKKAPKIGAMITREGKKWIRIISENVAGVVKGSENPCSARDFVEKTGKQKGTIGNLYDESAELSQKRAEKSPTGRDPIKDKWFDDYSKKRRGQKHYKDDRP